MKKSLFVAVLLLVGTVAFAQVPFNTPTTSQVINVHATIQQSASLSLSSNNINFNVTDPSVVTSGSNDVQIQGTVNVAKGHTVGLWMTGSALVGANDGQTIPADHVWGKTTGASGFAPMDGGLFPIGFNAANGALGLTNGLNTTLSLQLQPVPTFVPDQYSGTVTVTLQVM